MFIFQNAIRQKSPVLNIPLGSFLPPVNNIKEVIFNREPECAASGDKQALFFDKEPRLAISN